MTLDLVASELMTLLAERWPFYGEDRIRAELYIEDALKNAARGELERCCTLLETHIAKIQRQPGAYSQNAANRLREVLMDLQREPDSSEPQVVPEEPEFLRW